MGVTYDARALLAAERNDRAMWALHAGLIAQRVSPTVPSPALAQMWPGGVGRQAPLSRLLRLCENEPLTEEQSRRVGILVGASGHADIVDVAVVEGAIRRGDGMVTSGEGHIRGIAEAAGARLRIQAI